MTRRSLLRRTTASTLAALALEAQEATPIAPNSAQLRWLGNAVPCIDTGVSFCVPWPRGAVYKTQTFALTAPDGAAAPALIS